MAIADLGACEWFVMELRRSGLIERGQLEQVVGGYLKRQPRSEPQVLAEFLVSQQVLTAYQADRVLTGKSQGLVLGPYTLLDAIGTGSMGAVFKAVSKTDNQNYAVKVLPRRSMWNVRLARRQVRSFGQFTHPSVVPFVDVGTAGGLHYLAWPLADGESLATAVEREGKLSPGKASLYALQIANGLAVSHQNGLFHGLLKPSNVLIGTDQTARILDFGIGSLLVENDGESLVDTMSTANTLTSGLDCASPECIMDPANRTPAGDQYSLGCTLYFALTGRVPFPEGSAVEKMMAHQMKEPTPVRELNPEVPEGLAAVIDRLMKKDPGQRYALCEEVVEALEPFADQPVKAPSISLTQTPRPLGTLPGRGAGAMPRAMPRAAAPVPAPRVPPAPVGVQLPAGVRMAGKPTKSKADETDVAAAAAAAAAPAPSRPEARFGSLTLVVGGLVLVSTAYLALVYFGVIR